MARTFGKNSKIVAAAQAESVSAARAGAIMGELSDATVTGMTAFIDDLAHQGANEAEWRAGFSAIANYPDNETRFVMRIIASFTDGRFLP